MKTIMLTAALVAAMAVCLDQLYEVAEGAPRSSCSPATRAVFAAEGHAVVREACEVEWCESRGDRWATNGQYLGHFQLGAWARSRFLRGAWWNGWRNAEAARRLFRWNGRRWAGQWSCDPR